MQGLGVGGSSRWIASVIVAVPPTRARISSRSRTEGTPSGSSAWKSLSSSSESAEGRAMRPSANATIAKAHGRACW
jgi:hypothetical protein